MRPKIDHDRLFKELIKTFFFEFLQLFFPALAVKLDRDSIEFLDKQVFTDVTEGDTHEADLVVKVRLSGEESFFLFHVEPQSTAQARFPGRMFSYFARLHQQHGKPVYPIAVLSYETPKAPAPRRYDMVIDGWRILSFRYRALQLNRMRWRDYVRNENPVAVALAAKMEMKPAERRRVKFECLRLLWTMKLDPARTRLIAGFINTYLRLPAADNSWVEEKMAAVAPESEGKKVLFWTDWHDQGFDQGLERGLEQGIEKEHGESKQRLLRTLERNYRRRFASEPPAGLREAAAKLDLDSLDSLNDALLDFIGPDDATTWLAGRSG